ncbi:SMI1/KNR4 family protein [Allorhodopirellula heiligendammensis]|uniref:Uncharacterized protein n=1 Tax=Allorhodopirellula heiligendammensis TaxID=2714739 RepID=A0A5C6C3R3_9BACT|nr:SMI1/KNR4 family protein [Allorhodopirellula heiligendammensis]TWU17934.1 hypothetical protein Poly21_00860 [Allorhodopirellula heiligendammensis]
MTKPDSTTANSSVAKCDGTHQSDPRHEPAKGSLPWSKKLAERFGLDFGEELNQWWDEQCTHSPGPGEFRYPVLPQTLLATVPDPIWPPLMPPNFLPLLGNGAGDWLCVRLLDPDIAALTGRSTDICQWYHGGGDWLPWGDQLSEALLFDWLLNSLPQSDCRHAEPASESFDGGDEQPHDHDVRPATVAWREHAWGRWVIDRLPTLANIDWVAASDPRHLATDLLNQQLCEIPVRCQLVIDSLASALSCRLTPKIAHDLGLTWNDWMRWCFDLRSMPSEVSSRLQASLGLSSTDFDPAQQRWDDVVTHAAAVCQKRPDLSWGHDLLGYAQWSRGDMQDAERAFSNAVRCSVFSDQSVRLRTHWATANDGISKFSARFLAEMSASSHCGDSFEPQVQDQLGLLPAVIDRACLLEFLGPSSAEDSSSVRQRYSQMLVDEASVASSPATSARLLYAAGWDLGAEPMRRYGELLDRYMAACQAAGWSRHERLASVHRDGLKARYNL